MKGAHHAGNLKPPGTTLQDAEGHLKNYNPLLSGIANRNSKYFRIGPSEMAGQKETMMNPQPIGKGKIRATIRNKLTRERLAKIQGVTVDGSNVYYPVSMAKQVNEIVWRSTSKRI